MSTSTWWGSPTGSNDRANASTDGGRPVSRRLLVLTAASLRSGLVPIDPVTVDIVQLDPDLPLPSYAHDGDAGLDLYARELATIPAGGHRFLMPTGISIAIPLGFCGLVMPRSGLALKHGISIVNSPGTIDSDFRGEVGIVLINHGQEPFTIEPLSRIAQIVIARVEQVAIEEAESLTETSRGAGGYGSTGR